MDPGFRPLLSGENALRTEYYCRHPVEKRGPSRNTRKYKMDTVFQRYDNVLSGRVMSLFSVLGLDQYEHHASH
jgi:hypothetical protein